MAFNSSTLVGASLPRTAGSSTRDPATSAAGAALEPSTTPRTTAAPESSIERNDPFISTSHMRMGNKGGKISAGGTLFIRANQHDRPSLV